MGYPDVVWQDPVSGTTQIWYLGGVQGNVVHERGESDREQQLADRVDRGL